MIEHLRGRDRKLEPLGWTGPDAEWIALVCLHSGIFTRTQFCHYFGVWRSGAQRFVQTLIERKAAVESEWPLVNGGGKTCRISSKPIYRALGVENIRHRRKASKPVVMRRLLSLDFILEHPGLNWLPAEQEKVEFFEKLGLPRRLIPRRIYYGVAGNQKRLRRSGPRDRYRTPLVGSRAWAALGCAPHEGPTGPGDRDCG